TRIARCEVSVRRSVDRGSDAAVTTRASSREEFDTRAVTVSTGHIAYVPAPVPGHHPNPRIVEGRDLKRVLIAAVAGITLASITPIMSKAKAQASYKRD